MTKVKVLFQKLTSISKKMITLFILPEKWHHTKLRGMHIADDITTDDTTVVFYHDGSTTSTLTSSSSFLQSRVNACITLRFLRSSVHFYSIYFVINSFNLSSRIIFGCALPARMRIFFPFL